MPLGPTVPRRLQHVRRVHYHGYERDDGLWDIEGELHDSKTYDAALLRHAADRTGEPARQRRAGQPIHHMWLRVTVDRQLVVQAIAVAMDTHPLADCPQAQPALQQMVGCSMARGWRQAIQKNLGGVVSCTHLRELLFNLATAAFQSVPTAFAGSNDQPPRHLGQCTGWDFNGNGVKEYFPQFYGRANPGAAAAPATPTAPAAPAAAAAHPAAPAPGKPG